MSDSPEATGNQTPSRQEAKALCRTRIKICGLRDVDTALAAAEAGADFIGLNFVEASPRYVAPAVARDICESLPAHVTAVGLFCNQPIESVLDIVQAVGLDTVQLHGEETAAYAKQLVGLHILKAFGFDAEALPIQLNGWVGMGDQLTSLLIDAPPKPDALITGGAGEAFDWSQLVAFEQSDGFADLPPYLLAGGLTPQNVGEAIRTVRPWGVDVSSGVESSRGVKDSGLIEGFCDAVIVADSELTSCENL
ncbi:MAG: phosphoribosylanthranilate isomerase [Planctomycetota bacterium]